MYGWGAGRGEWGLSSHESGSKTTVGSGLFVRFFVWVILVAAILKRVRGGVAVQMIQLA